MIFRKRLELSHQIDIKLELLQFEFLYTVICILLTTRSVDDIICLGDSVRKIDDEKRLIELEYNLICDFIKLRNKLGLSQQKMADECGVIREMIAVIENRKKHPQINTLIKILEPFGYTLSITKIKEENNG